MMKKFTLSLAALAAFAMLSMDMQAAKAAPGFGGFGLHVGGRRVHLEIGNPHGYRASPAYHSSYFAPNQHVRYNSSHFNYYQPETVPYGNHNGYIPRYNGYHQSGHWGYGYGGHY